MTDEELTTIEQAIITYTTTTNKKRQVELTLEEIKQKALELEAELQRQKKAVIAASYAFSGIAAVYGYNLVDGLEPGTYKDSYLVHDDYLQPFNNGLYDKVTNTWDHSLGKVPTWAIVPVIFN